MIGGEEDYVLPTNIVCPVARAVVRGSTIYVPNAETRNNPLNRRDVTALPRVGDCRVKYSCVLPHEISLVSKQHGDTFVPYVAKNGRKVQLLANGVKDVAEMFADAQSANTTIGWLIRIGGFLLMFIGLSMMFKPLSVLADVLPILGDIVEMGMGLVAGLIAVVCAIVTIAIAWIFYRPILGGVLLAVAVGFIALLIFMCKAAKSAKSASGAAA